MPKSRNRKGHKKKVDARRQRIMDSRRRMEKQQHDFLMKLIEAEKQRGLFNESGTMSGLPTELDFNIDTTDGPTLDGPSI